MSVETKDNNFPADVYINNRAMLMERVLRVIKELKQSHQATATVFYTNEKGNGCHYYLPVEKLEAIAFSLHNDLKDVGCADKSKEIRQAIFGK